MRRDAPAPSRPQTANGVRTALLALALVASASCGDRRVGGNRPTPTPIATPTSSPLPNPFPIVTGLGANVGVDAAWGGDRYLVTYGAAIDRVEPDVLGVRLTSDGRVLDAPPFVLSDFGASPYLGEDASYSPGGIAFSGTEFGVFFFGAGTIAREGPPGEVIGFVPVPPEGPPALPATAVDQQASFSMAQTSLSPPIAAVSNGADFLGVYQRIASLVGAFSLSQVLGQIVTVTDEGVRAQVAGPFSGIVPPTDGIVTSGSAPGVAIDSAVTLVAFVVTSVSESDSGGALTLVVGVVLTPQSATFVPLSPTEIGAQGTAVASDGMNFLVVWTTPVTAGANTLTELRAVRFAPTTGPDPAGSFLVAGGDAAKQLVGIAFAGGVYLVAWIEDGVLRGARLGTAGTASDAFVIDPGPIVSAALTSDGERFLAVFDRAEGTSSSEVVGRFVDVE